MLTHVERKHWYTQLPFSWGVETLLVIALVAGTVFAATQVRGREATIADQAVMLETARVEQVQTLARMNATVTLQDEFRAQLEQGLAAQAVTIQQTEQQLLTARQAAFWDAELVKTYGALETHRAALAQAERGEYGEVYESVAIEAAAVAEAQNRIEMLLAQRRIWEMVRFGPTSNSTSN
jgi:hypothetical protein